WRGEGVGGLGGCGGLGRGEGVGGTKAARENLAPFNHHVGRFIGDARVSSYFGSSHRARTTIWMLLRDNALGGGLELEGGGEQGARVRVLRIGEHFGRGALLHHLAVAHDEETAGERGDHAQIVR